MQALFLLNPQLCPPLPCTPIALPSSYAFGITLWELCTGCKPFLGIPHAFLGHKVEYNGDVGRRAWGLRQVEMSVSTGEGRHRA